WRFASRAGPIEIPGGATHRWTSRQTNEQWAGASRFPVGNPRMTRFELQPQRPRAEEAPAMPTGTRDPNAPDRVFPVFSASVLYCLSSASLTFPRPERIRVFRFLRG